MNTTSSSPLSLSPDLPEESHTYIGVVVSVCGNVSLYAIYAGNMIHDDWSNLLVTTIDFDISSFKSTEICCKFLLSNTSMQTWSVHHNKYFFSKHNKLQANAASDTNRSLPYTSPQTTNNSFDNGYGNYQKSNVEEDNTDYLKSKLWWMGITLMVIGEIGNFVGKQYDPLGAGGNTSHLTQTTALSIWICPSVNHRSFGNYYARLECHISPYDVERTI